MTNAGIRTGGREGMNFVVSGERLRAGVKKVMEKNVDMLLSG